jgi:hydroxymethylglutaryl-CoA lyase
LLDLPAAVTVYEVGPRDGLQNEREQVGAELKIELIERLAAAGLPAVEATSFVRPDRVPQLADAEQVAAALRHGRGTRYPVLVPNAGGLRRAIGAGVEEIAVFGSATESFARRNLNRSVDESLAMFAPVVEEARAAGLRVRGYVSMVWGDPWEGAVPVEQAAGAARRLWELGLDELALGDTIGVATPLAVQEVIAATGVPRDAIAVHFHDTYGQALANVLAALQAGVTTVDASVAGLGGCPYAKSATGNLATEDLVYMLDGLGIATGVDLAAVVDTANWIAGVLGRQPGAVARARGPTSTPSPPGRP